ncbi:MAG: hypothetical protein II961_06335 [Candidatus Riflebacteria bacterium]|nr:hypothetical protein [Candidatus Riflebacteria bacterium]
MFFISAKKIKLLLLTILFITILHPVFAEPPVSISATVTSADNPARINSVINVSVYFKSNANGNNAVVDLSGICTPGLNTLSITNIGGENYFAQGTFTVVEGTKENQNPVNIPIFIGNASDTISFSPAPSYTFDNKPPTRNGGMTCTVNGANYVAGRVLKAGDVVVLTQKVNDDDINSIIVDLSPIGYPPANMTSSANRTFTTTFTVPNNYELVLPCNLTMVDDVGNTTTYQDNEALNLTIDSRAPTLTVTIANNAGNVVAIPGHTFTFTATISNYDGDTVTVTSNELTTNHPSAYDGTLPKELVVNGNPTAGSTATFQGTLTFLPDQTCYYDNTLTFQFTAKDKAGNTITKEATYNNIVDLGEFSHKTSKVTIYSAENRVTNVATATSKLYFHSEIVTTNTEMTTVVVDLSPIGGTTLNLIYDDTLVPPQYVATYTGGLTMLQLDGEQVTFEVTATDRYNNTITKTTTPPIIVDNVGPRIESFNITGATGTDGSILNKDKITFSATISGANAPNNPVTIDLTALDDSGVKNLTTSSGNNWQYRHTVASGTVDESDFPFTLIAQDSNGNISSKQITHPVDNEPPVYISQSVALNQQNYPYIIIGDSITTKVLLANSDDGITVVIDLTQLGNLSKEYMSSMGNEFSYSFDIATGPINNGAIFPVEIKDNAGNKAVHQDTGDIHIASFTFLTLDQNPPDPQEPTVTLVNHTSTTDKYPDSINTKKTITFTLPYIKETSNDDHATATLDVTYLCKLEDGSMKYVDNNLNLVTPPPPTNFISMEEGSNLYRQVIIATESIGLEEQTNYQFNFMMYDKSGNKVAKQSTYFQKVDLNPPVINSITVGTSGATPLRIGDTISFTVNVSGNDGQRPIIDLTSIDPDTGSVPMIYDPANIGIYTYDVKIATGTLNNVNASWAITLYDGCDNSVTSYTPEIAIDNKPPEITMFTVNADNITNNNRINYTENSVAEVNFSLVAPEHLTVSLDLTAIGGSANQTPLVMSVPPNYIYTYNTTTSQTSEEYENYKFPALITDDQGNRLLIYTMEVGTVDCQVPIINTPLCGAEITGRSDSLPTPKNQNIVRIGDTITFYASMTACIDATASVTFSIDPGVASISKEMVFNEDKNRHEISFTIKAPNIVENGATWGELNLNDLPYVISAADDAGNIATPYENTTTFVAKNVYPTIASFSLIINPDYDVPGILNIASGTDRTTRDLLIASATLDNNANISTASLDLSGINGPQTLYIASITNSVVNSSGNGIDIASYSEVDYMEVSIPITIYDEAGYSCNSSHELKLDTKAPEITGATFDGEKLIVSFSEVIDNIDKTQWTLIGSSTVGTTVKLDLSDTNLTQDPWTDLFEEIEIHLTLEGRREVTGWASSPLYLEVKRTTTNAAAEDIYKNWLKTYDYLPITITDSSWREEPAILNIVMVHDWPNTITLDIQFEQEMDTSTFVASDAVFFVDDPGLTEFADVSYDSWYVIQKEDVCNWSDNKNLRITLQDNGRDWIANKLTNNPEKTLKFAQKSSANRMISSIFNKKLKYYTIEQPFVVSDNRESTPISALNILSSPKPVIDLASATLTLTFNDRVVLFTDNFRTINETDPQMGMPTPSQNKGSRLHLNNIKLFNLENDQSFTLETNPIANSNNEYASTTVKINLTETDIDNILNFYNTADTLSWGLQIEADSFVNFWGMGNTRYKPTTPGTIEVIEAVPTENAAIIAVSVSDMPPTKDDAGNFLFDFELTKIKAGEITLPFLTTTSPNAAIFEISTGDRIASATFTGWSQRTVRNVERTIASFKTSEDFNKDVDGVPAELRIYGLKDIFGNETPVQIASYVYDRAQKNDSQITGFNTASEAFIVDNVAPTATIQPELLGLTPAGQQIFTVDYSESMDTNYTPSMSIATESTVIGLSFVQWDNSDKRAIFSNNQAITAETPNGTWKYVLAGGQDLAGNAFANFESALTIKSEIPKVLTDSMHLYSIRKNIDNNNVVTDKQLNFDASPDYTRIGFKYVSADTENLPHTLCFFDTSDQEIGSATIVQSGVNATATFSILDFDTVPTTNSSIIIKVVDKAGNMTESIGSIEYYAKAPIVSEMTLTGVATLSQGIYYYRTALDDMTFKGTITPPFNNPLNLIIASFSAPMSPVATMTLTTEDVISTTLTNNFGQSLAEDIYTIYIADDAGNLHTTADPIMLIVDDTPPEIDSIVPGPTDLVANTPIGMATFTVKFTELMDTTVTPTLVLATSTLNASIGMQFVGWGDDLMTASFTNAVDIVATYPVGIYNYTVTNAQDLAGNVIGATPDSFTTDIQPKGPGVSSLTILTLQPDISDEVFENRDFNPIKYSTGDEASVTFKIDYVSGPFNTPHQLLIYDEDGNNIATLAVSVGNPGYATWDAGDMPTTDSTYSFKIADNLMNISPETGYLKWQFKVDTTTPDVTSIDFNDGGIGQTVAGIRYYSPTVPATFTVTTTETDDLVLIASSTATTTYIITASTSHSISFGSSLADGEYTLGISDLAGNINDGVSMKITVDSIPPQVTSAYASDELFAPLEIVGKTATFLVTFDKIMNQNITPTVQLATDTSYGTTEIATLTFQSWRDDQSCLFVTNNVFDTINFPVGTASIVVSEARDLAGNLIATDTYGEVQVISQNPKFYASLTTQQTMISDAYLNDIPFSLRAEPNIATLTIVYDTITTNGPYALDHTLLLFDGTGVQIATHTLTGGATEITVDAPFFGDFEAGITPPEEFTGTFTIMLKDSVGNIASDSNNFEIKYDSIRPKLNDIIQLTGPSSASVGLNYYYNPDILGNISTDIILNASDAIKLVVYGVSSSPYEIIATRTYPLTLTNALTYSYEGNLEDIYGTPLPEGTYTIAAIDMAGNFAEYYSLPGFIQTANILIDKTAPTVLVATITDQLYISSGEAGMATFSIQFNESMFEEAFQYLEIATTSYKIPCRFIRLETTAIASDTAIFESSVAIPNTIPQGNYVYHIIGTDLTGNKVETDFGEVFVKSAGPVVSYIHTYSYQQTTASDTLESGNEYHYDDVFSFNVEPNAATMTIKLSEAPDGDPATVYLTFLKKVTVNQLTEEIMVASYPLALDGDLMATFTWDAVTEPIVATSATFIIRIADTNGDLSFYNYEWSVDSEEPTYTGISFNSGIDFPDSETVYMNPYRHTNFEVTFKNLIDTNPRLRIRSKVSTDTYALTPLSSNGWKAPFRAKYSRDTGNPDDIMPDGVYDIGLTDQAGNLAASDTEDLYKLVIDTKNPEIGTYTLKINGSVIGSYCSPSEDKPLVISLETEEPLTATGAYYIDVYNAGNVRINRLNIVDNGGTLEASWNAKNDSGATVSDGVYTFRVSDICGNSSETATSTTAITSPFQVMSPAVQTGSNTIKLWFNHGIEPASLGATPISCVPPLTISNIQIEDERAISFIATGMTHGASYTLTVNDSLTNIYGSTLSTTASSAVFYADIKGPAIVGTSFDKVNSQGEIMVVFDQPLDKTTGEATSSYIIQDSVGNTIPITTAILQSDGTSVLLVASGTFIENADYRIKAPGVKDELGNDSCESSISGFGFKGRDVTPPTFVISAFSNPANENDIIIIAISNEELIKVPTLTITHGSASPIKLTMQKNATNPLAFMSAASLKASNGQSGTLKVEGEDLNGNKGSETGSFVIANVKVNSNQRLTSDDKQFSLSFDKDSLKEDATVKILKRSVIKEDYATGTIRTSLQNEYIAMRGLRASVATSEEEATNSELTPITDAYEAAVNSSKVNKGIVASMKIPESASQTTGLGLFYQKNGSWKYISSNITADKEIKARINSSQVFAIMRDSVAPTIKLDESVDLTKAFETARPEFRGSIKDFGSGIDTNSLEAKIDSKIQGITLDNDGNFKFKSLSELINGNHDLVISAKDKTGNLATSGSMRFALVLPFEFKQIIQYPNPAKNNMTIRIRTNSTGINCNIRIKIYDVAGHKVADFDEGDVLDRNDGNYEVRWDLRNKKGKKVANGVYIAKLEAINPETGKKIKATLKLAVLK